MYRFAVNFKRVFEHFSSAEKSVVSLHFISSYNGGLQVSSYYGLVGIFNTADGKGWGLSSTSIYPADFSASGYSSTSYRPDLGTSSAKFDDIHAVNGTIQTSDRTEKQDIEELTDAEKRVAVAAKGLLRKYRLKTAVAEKGDDARIHFGIIAQDLQAAFSAEGLDAGRYGMFIYEHHAEDNPSLGIKAGTHYGVRYNELLAFIIAAL